MNAQAELAELLATLDPDCIFRSIALALATQADTSKDHQKILSVAATYLDFIDPFALDDASDEVAHENRRT